MNLIDWIVLCITIAGLMIFAIAVIAGIEEMWKRDSLDGDSK